VRFNAGQSVVPFYDGWIKNPDGTFDVIFGYYNRNWKEYVHVPVGPDNRVLPGGPDRGQPTHFVPRQEGDRYVQRFAVRVRVPADFGKQEVTWVLTSNGRIEQATGSLLPSYQISEESISAGRELGTGDPRATYKAPGLAINPVVGAAVGSPVELTALITDMMPGVGLNSREAAPFRRVVVERHGNAAPAASTADTGSKDSRPEFGALRNSNPASGGGRSATVRWLPTRGPAKVIFDHAEHPTTPIAAVNGKAVTSVRFSEPGTYTLVASASLRGMTTTKSIEVVVGGRPHLTRANEPEVTFAKHIAPIIQRSCQQCHRAGSVAPMSLMTYEEVRPWARSIKTKVANREMPPWYIDRNVGITKFKNDPSLTDAEIALIGRWADSGAPRGNPADMPPPREFKGFEHWSIGEPDIVVTLDEPYMLAASGPEIPGVNILVDPKFTEDMYVAAIESKPLDAASFKVVHHFTTNIVEDPDDDPSGLFLNEYALGKNGDIFPENSGRFIPAGTKINFNLHLQSRGENVPVRVQLGLKLFPKGVVPKYVAFTQKMGEWGELDIPAGQIARHDGYFVLPKPAMIASFQPHLHNRGKAQCLEVIYPNKGVPSARPGPLRTETLSCVSDYQFGWHISYPYAEDVAPLLPAGAIVHVTSWHDNTSANRWNPSPKTWVGRAERTVDDMSFAWFNVIYLDEDDYNARVAERRKQQQTTTNQQ
jgi:hypothetical protein